MMMQKDEDFTGWFERVILEAQIVDDRYPVKGFTVYMGWGYRIARAIARMLEERLEEEGHQPVQFPVVIPEDAFMREAEHIEGFAASVFWITHAGDTELDRRLLLRPTSETAIYPLFKLWIRSHADLPLRVHQTCNVYRYETKATKPLYRGREFLWNEAHTAHRDYEDAERQVRKGVEIYRYVYDRLGLSYLILRRPDFDKFAGADYSVAFDTWNPDGKVNQIGTVHQLGENFAKAFELEYEDEKGEHRLASTTCYGMGIGRVIAAIIAHHGDDHGLILPPAVAPIQVIIIPIPFKGYEESVKRYAREVEAALKEGGIRVAVDDDDRLRPGEKYYKWEMYGVPLRAEVGPTEVNERTVTLVRRDTFQRSKATLEELKERVEDLLERVYQSLRERSWRRLEREVVWAENLDELKAHIEERRIVKVNWCGDPHCAFRIKDEVAGEVRGTAWDGGEEAKGPCIICGGEAKHVAIVARTF